MSNMNKILFLMLIVVLVCLIVDVSKSATKSVKVTGVVRKVVSVQEYGPRMFLDLNDDRTIDIWFNCPLWAIRAFPPGSVVDVVGDVVSTAHPIALTDIVVTASIAPSKITPINEIMIMGGVN